MSEEANKPEEAKAAPAEGGAPAANDEFSLVYDVPVTVHVQFGEATLSIGEILKCGKGSVIKLNQKIGDPFRIMLMKQLLAEGEVVEAGEHLGIKITNVFKPGAPAA